MKLQENKKHKFKIMPKGKIKKTKISVTVDIEVNNYLEKKSINKSKLLNNLLLLK